MQMGLSAPCRLDAAAARYLDHGDDDSLRAVTEAAKGLVCYFAKLYGKGCDHDDVIQSGMLGLMKALKGYDPAKGACFTTYASHCIMGEIRHMVRKNASYYRPGCIIELQHKVDSVVEEYLKLHGNVPAYAYIAKQLNIREESVAEVMKAGLISFDDIDTNLIRSSAYETFKLPIEDKLTLYQAIRKLSALQQKVIGMLFFQDMSQQQVAETLGISQRKVSRIKESCLHSMYEELHDKVTP
jgi:RNA polymerase sigma-B factor